MRLLILTIVTMGGFALVMEFVLVGTARLAKEAERHPVEFTFPGKSGPQGDVKPRPNSDNARVLPGKDEERARRLWRSQQLLSGRRARRDVLRAIVELDSSYRGPARHALEKVEGAIRSESVKKRQSNR